MQKLSQEPMKKKVKCAEDVAAVENKGQEEDSSFACQHRQKGQKSQRSQKNVMMQELKQQMVAMQANMLDLAAKISVIQETDTERGSCDTEDEEPMGDGVNLCETPEKPNHFKRV